MIASLEKGDRRPGFLDDAHASWLRMGPGEQLGTSPFRI